MTHFAVKSEGILNESKEQEQGGDHLQSHVERRRSGVLVAPYAVHFLLYS